MKNFQEGYLRRADPEEVKQLLEKRKRLMKNKDAAYTKSKEMREIAQVPLSIILLMERLDPDFWKDKKKIKKFLDENPVFKTVKNV